MIGVIRRIEHLMVVLPVRGDAPPAAQREEPLLVDAALERAAKIEEIAVAPRGKDQDERRRVLEHRARLAVPGKAIGEAALHDVDTIHESAERLESGTYADQLGVIAVGVAGAVVQRHIPQLARP